MLHYTFPTTHCAAAVSLHYFKLDIATKTYKMVCATAKHVIIWSFENFVENGRNLRRISGRPFFLWIMFHLGYNTFDRQAVRSLTVDQAGKFVFSVSAICFNHIRVEYWSYSLPIYDNIFFFNILETIRTFRQRLHNTKLSLSLRTTYVYLKK